MTDVDLPRELTEWTKARVDALRALLDEADQLGQDEDPAAWVLETLRVMADVDREATRAVYLLTAYAMRSNLATATEAAKASGVTLTGAQNRVGSKLATETWTEVFPPRPVRRRRTA